MRLFVGLCCLLMACVPPAQKQASSEDGEPDLAEGAPPDVDSDGGGASDLKKPKPDGKLPDQSWPTDLAGQPTDDAAVVFTADGGSFICKTSGGACSGAAECCGVLECDDGVCKTPLACRATGGACTLTKECCTGLACLESQCQPVTAIDVLSRPCTDDLPCVAEGLDCWQLATAAIGVCTRECDGATDCPNSMPCVAGFCLKGCPDGDGCASGSTCFSSYACWPDCRSQPGFCGSDQACGGNGLCCQAAAAECDDVLACCEGLSCSNGTCEVAPSCRQKGAACGHDEQCCEGLVCHLGTCQPPPACKNLGASCVTGAECCGKTACYEGKCSTFCGGGTGGASVYCLDDEQCCNGYACTDVGTTTQCLPGPRLCTEDYETCIFDSECCTGFCNPQLYCSPACGLLLDSCSASNPCCDDYVCNGGKCEMPACAGLGQTCGTGKYCCGTNVCQGGKCKAPTVTPTCKQSGQSCGGLAECCNGLVCEGGQCQAPLSCLAAAAECTTDAACCEGLGCNLGVCETPSSCKTAGASCSNASECCAGLPCTGGTCGGGATCASPGSSCAGGESCCPGSECQTANLFGTVVTACATVTSCRTPLFRHNVGSVTFHGSDPTIWARCDGGKGAQVCYQPVWVEFDDGRCFCTPPCKDAAPGTACTSDGSGVCMRLDSEFYPVCVHRNWGLCEADEP